MRRRNLIQLVPRTKRKVAGVILIALFSWILMGAALKNTEQTGSFPLEGARYRVSDRYGKRQDPLTGRETLHAGVDLACAEGTAVLAVLDGLVITARYSQSYGNYIVLCHADGLETLYAHLQYLYVRAGEVVRAGEQIGTAGKTGRATGSHLHFELCRKGERCDPSAFLGVEG